jgi:hypothetical protein
MIDQQARRDEHHRDEGEHPEQHAAGEAASDMGVVIVEGAVDADRLHVAQRAGFKIVCQRYPAVSAVSHGHSPPSG